VIKVLNLSRSHQSWNVLVSVNLGVLDSKHGETIQVLFWLRASPTVRRIRAGKNSTSGPTHFRQPVRGDANAIQIWARFASFWTDRVVRTCPPLSPGGPPASDRGCFVSCAPLRFSGLHQEKAASPLSTLRRHQWRCITSHHHYHQWPLEAVFYPLSIPAPLCFPPASGYTALGTWTSHSQPHHAGENASPAHYHVCQARAWPPSRWTGASTAGTPTPTAVGATAEGCRCGELAHHCML
jgi:hypothetical protein